MAIDIDAIYFSTYEHYKTAKITFTLEVFLEHSSKAISNVIPGFDEENIKFGSYDKENFVSIIC